jgi:histidyl-tRNA synthetase
MQDCKVAKQTSLQAIRGMNDLVPAQMGTWHYLEDRLRNMAATYGYAEIRTPALEQTALFERSIGEVTDIVEKEMYTFQDRNGDSLTLRPELTAGCVRAGIQHGLFYNQVQRLWYLGPVFRHERPQQGRYRQFYQFGVEAFGMSGPDIDAELIFMTARLWKELGVLPFLRLEINSLGTKASRDEYRQELVAYFTQHFEQLDEDSRRRLHTNPLRILDSKNPAMKDLLYQAPKLTDFLEPEAKQHFKELCHYLDAAEIKYEINPRLVRGLDYYGLTVFEWITEKLGSQGTVCAGGRYDQLVEQLGGRPTPAIGFGLGIDRVVLLLDSLSLLPRLESVDIYLITLGDDARLQGLLLAEQLRTEFPALKLISDCSGASIKSQFKQADKSGARIALLLGEEELKDKKITVKFLRSEQEQQRIAIETLAEYLHEITQLTI